MRINNGIFMVSAILFAAVFVAGCSSPQPGAAPGPDNGLSKLEPSQMVLKASDLPAGYTLREERQTDVSRMDPSIWNVKKGYEVAFTRGTEAAGSDVIVESLVIEPADRVSGQIGILTGEYAKKGIQPVLLPGPVIGDASTAFTLPGTAAQNGETFVIVFTRKDAVVLLMMNGPHRDYAVLQSVAGTAAGKIG